MNNNVKAIKAGYALTDADGNVLTPFKYEKIGVYENFICYTFEGKVGFMDKAGKELTYPIYENIKVGTNLAIVRMDKNDKYGLVFKDMTCLIPCECKDIQNIYWMGKTYFILTDKDYKKCVCYIDEENNVQYVIADKYDQIYQWGEVLMCSLEDCIYLRHLPNGNIGKIIKGKVEKRYSFEGCLSIAPYYYEIESDRGGTTIFIYDEKNPILRNSDNNPIADMVSFGEYDIVDNKEFEISFLEHTRLIVTRRHKFFDMHCICRNENGKIIFKKIAENINIVNYTLDYLICGYVILYDENGVYYLWNLRRKPFACVLKGKKLKFSYEMRKRDHYFDYDRVKAFIDKCAKMKK